MWMYEESLHVPLIVRYPESVKPASVSDAFVSVLDFAPTFLDYAGIEKNKQFQGQSIKPVLSSEAPDDRKSIHFYHYFGQFEVPSHYGIRTKDYKLIHFYSRQRKNRNGNCMTLKMIQRSRSIWLIILNTWMYWNE